MLVPQLLQQHGLAERRELGALARGARPDLLDRDDLAGRQHPRSRDHAEGALAHHLDLLVVGLRHDGP
jgi:hypothetical protein